MGVPLPTRDQRRAVVLARWRLRRALLDTLDEIKVKDGCQCSICIRSAIETDEPGVAERVAAKQSLLDVVDKIIRNQSGHYLAHSHDDANCVSYARNKQVKYLPERRTRTTLGRYIRRQFPDVAIKDEFLEQYTSKVMAMLTGTDDRFRIIEGREIVDAYRDEIGGHSCMTSGGSEYTEIYALNPDVVKMLVFDDGSMTGRCLIWKTNEGPIVADRIYPNGGRHIEEFKRYISEQGWHRREDNSYPQGQGFVGLDGDLTVTLEIPDPPIYPYMDSFRLYRESRDVSWSDNTITLHTMHGYNTLSSTEGDGPGHEDNRVSCYICNDRIDEDDVYTSNSGRIYCASCYNARFTSCGRCGDERASDSTHTVRTGRYSTEEWCGYCFEIHAFTCEGCGDNFHIDNRVVVEGGEYCSSCSSSSEECSGCGERFFESNMTERDGEWYCNDCLPEEGDDDDESESETEDDCEAADGQAAEVAATA